MTDHRQGLRDSLLQLYDRQSALLTELRQVRLSVRGIKGALSGMDLASKSEQDQAPPLPPARSESGGVSTG